jgi:cytochrome c biogenesis protein ResB
VLLGFVLQSVAENYHYANLQVHLSAPVNIFFGIVIVLLIVIFSFFHESPVYRWFSGIPFAVTLIAALLIFCSLLGLIPQVPRMHSGNMPKDWYSVLGLRQVNSSWSFVFLYFLLLLALGMVIARRLIRFNIKHYGFYLSHIGLWIFLFAAGLGGPDKRDYTLYVAEGESNSLAHQGNQLSQLPFSVRLNDFDIEEYPQDSLQQTRRVQATPKRFVSDVEVLTEKGKRIQALIEVNKPLKTGAWTIYQYSYDMDAGKRSKYSIFKIVYDPWLPLVYAGIILLAAGAVCMVGFRKNDVE